MIEILQATYQNGHLILNKKLAANLEGKTLNLIILETNLLQTKKERFLEFLAQQAFDLPANYTFNRAELYER